MDAKTDVVAQGCPEDVVAQDCDLSARAQHLGQRRKFVGGHTAPVGFYWGNLGFSQRSGA